MWPRSLEDVAAPRYRPNERRPVPKRLSDIDDALDERAVSDGGPLPDLVEKLLFGDKPTLVHHEVEQYVVRLRAQLDFIAVSQKRATPGIEREITKGEPASLRGEGTH